MPEKELNKALLVCLAFLLFFSLVPFDWHKVGDYPFHYEKAGQECNGTNCKTYYYLFHFLASFFAFTESAFIHFTVFLIVFITPMLFYFLTKKWIVTWLFFSTTQYVYIVVNAAYPQALAMIFLILLLIFKNPFARVAILIVGTLAHSQAFMLMLLVWFFITLFENAPKLKNLFPACSAIFGKQATDPIGQKISVDVVDASGVVRASHVFVKDLVNFFVRVFPAPFLIMAFWQLKKEKEWAFIVLVPIVFYYGIVTSQSRVFLAVPILLLPALTRFYCGLDGWWKRGFIALTLVTFVINFGTWILYKINCVAT